MHQKDRHPEFEAEQQHLGQTIAAMIRQIEFWEDRDKNVGADLETSLTLADNAEEKAAMLSTHLDQPYFGSLHVRVSGRDQAVYVGKFAFADLQGSCSVVSWSSEVGSLFYSGATEWVSGRGKKGAIHGRRQLDIIQRRLLNVTDLLHDGKGRGQVLLKRLKEQSSAGMRDVLETLQPEQNEVMRSEAGQYLVVQGAAGSGKTTIGFHRLAWLCHPERGAQQARPEACLVLMPNEVLAHYAARVLPSLDLEGVRVTTPERWAADWLGLGDAEITDRTLTLLLTDQNNTRRTAAWRKAKLLGGARLFEVIRTYLWYKFHEAITGQTFSVGVIHNNQSIELSLSEEELGQLLHETFSENALLGYRETFRTRLNDKLNAQLGYDERLLRQTTNAVNALIGKIFLIKTPATEARELLQNRAALTLSGLLSDAELDLLLSDPLSGIPMPRRASMDVTEMPVMLTVQALVYGLAGRNGEFLDHILLDEAQDYSPLLYTLLARAVRAGHITALGDLNQGMHGYKGTGGWEHAVAALGGQAEIRTLSHTYRSTRQITTAGSRIAQTYSRTAPIVGVERDGGEVSYYQGKAEEQLAAEAVNDARAAGHENIAIITRRPAEAEQLSTRLRDLDIDANAITLPEHRYRGGLVVLPVSLAKGLEFSAAIVVGANAMTYDPATEYEQRLLYVAASRALHWLAFVSAGAFHPLVQP